MEAYTQSNQTEKPKSSKLKSLALAAMLLGVGAGAGYEVTKMNSGTPENKSGADSTESVSKENPSYNLVHEFDFLTRDEILDGLTEEEKLEAIIGVPVEVVHEDTDPADVHYQFELDGQKYTLDQTDMTKLLKIEHRVSEAQKNALLRASRESVLKDKSAEVISGVEMAKLYNAPLPLKNLKMILTEGLNTAIANGELLSADESEYPNSIFISPEKGDTPVPEN